MMAVHFINILSKDKEVLKMLLLSNEKALEKFQTDISSMRTDPQEITHANISNALDTIQEMQLHIKLIKTVANISQRESQKGNIKNAYATRNDAR